MKWKLHKLLSIIMVFALMVCLLPHPVAQAANDKSRIKTAISKYMVAVKGYNSKRIDKCLLNKKYLYASKKKLKRLNKHIRKLHSENTSYELRKIKVNGSRATAVIRVTYYNAYYDCKDAMRELAWDAVRYDTDIKLKELWDEIEWAYETEKDDVQNNTSDRIFYMTVKIPLIKKGNSWKIEKVNKNMQWFMDCGISGFFNECAKDPLMILR